MPSVAHSISTHAFFWLRFPIPSRAASSIIPLTAPSHSTVLTGLQYPRYAAGACAAYIFGRILYTLGYST